MRTLFRPVALVALLLCTISLSATPAAASAPNPSVAGAMSRTVFAYYYPWFSGAPSYRHWLSGTPGQVVGSSIPLLGAYDSRSASTLDTQMRWVAAAKIDVLTLSWWGQGSYEDQDVPAILAKAAQYGIKVSFMIDQYTGRTPGSVAGDIAYIYAKYGASPAFFRVSRPTEYGPSANPRGIFFIYNPQGSGWASAIDGLRGTVNDAIVLVRTNDSRLLSDSGVSGVIDSMHVDGMFNMGYYAAGYQSPLPESSNYLLVFAAQPGFDNTHSGGTLQLSRDGGATYDNVWRLLAQQKPEAVAVDSFNEWAETSQIEPALPNAGAPYVHLDYEGAYGLSGAAATTAYIGRTAAWVTAYKAA